MCQGDLLFVESIEDSEHFHPLGTLLEDPLTGDKHHGVSILDLLGHRSINSSACARRVWKDKGRGYTMRLHTGKY